MNFKQTEFTFQSDGAATDRSDLSSSPSNLIFYTNIDICWYGEAAFRALEKPVHWVGSSKTDLLTFPQEIVSEMGYALGVAQLGGKHPSAKPWKGDGAGVFEIVERFDGDAYRALYTVRFEGVIYVLHAFQKKSPSGKKTARTDQDMVTSRLKAARDHYEEHHQKGKAGKHGK
ncbi:type II toxin-antitoxin system RelE/ParE family toxin [Phenylobacterium sp.]|uniref:type II toxin-antitoxin system RelE/ParE family toxin n=1 Tax=Phenylobacterium sp. TaxID=1871053 RepID=UPI0025EDA69E|nr:type II toxin-antitoxin system RelE/ParE family toxin [Phenylobacterium sp.]